MSNADRSTPGSSASSGFSVRKSSPDLLRHVMEATLASGEPGMTAEEWQAIRSIADDPQNSSLGMDCVAELLVTALLSTRFPDLAAQETSQLMCQRIAASLCGDPTSMQRLKTFWNQLREPRP